ncbi:MAG TPA: hypothetical protein VMT95_05380 [Candidatus Binatia bacterium]|nr:hypothetical protein [Candidatus Binatia bacterium]
MSDLGGLTEEARLPRDLAGGAIGVAKYWGRAKAFGGRKRRLDEGTGVAMSLEGMG